MTAHKLLYEARQRPDGSYFFKPRKELDKPYKLIVVDELSMLPKDMWYLLLSHQIPVLGFGDPAQLSPISAETDNHLLDRPNVFLDEIVRQAKENEIIRLSMDIREGRPLSYFKGKDVSVISKKTNPDEHLKWADQVIVATNMQRLKINNYIRYIDGRGDDPEAGERIICLHNYWDCLDETKNTPLVNGTMGVITGCQKVDHNYAVFTGGFPRKAPLLVTSLVSDSNEAYTNLGIDYNCITTGKKFYTPQQEYVLKKALKDRDIPPLEFAFGYAITAHRAQGDEWDKVLVIEENFPFDREEHTRWLYTACTRSRDKLILVR